MHISPTCVGRDPPLPLFMVPLYQPYPLPRRKRMPRELGVTRLQGLLEEAKDLSEEEKEFDEKCKELRMRGYNYLVPLGKTLTLREEKIDQGSEQSSDDGDPQEDNVSVGVENDNAAPANTTGDGDGEGDEQDLDADIEDLDDEEEEEEEEEEPEPEDNEGEGQEEPDEEEEEEEEEEEDLDVTGFAPLTFEDLMYDD